MISVYIFTQFHKLLNDKFATDKCGACSGSPQSVKGIPCTHIYTYMYTGTSTVPQQLPMPHPQQFTTVNVRPLFTFIQNSLKFILVHTSAENIINNISNETTKRYRNTKVNLPTVHSQVSCQDARLNHSNDTLVLVSSESTENIVSLYRM